MNKNLIFYYVYDIIMPEKKSEGPFLVNRSIFLWYNELDNKIKYVNFMLSI